LRAADAHGIDFFEVRSSSSTRVISASCLKSKKRAANTATSSGQAVYLGNMRMNLHFYPLRFCGAILLWLGAGALVTAGTTRTERKRKPFVSMSLPYERRSFICQDRLRIDVSRILKGGEVVCAGKIQTITHVSTSGLPGCSTPASGQT
jgi:hypothetical protein